MLTALESATTNELVDELHKRHDSSVFCGYRQITKDHADFCVKWRGESKQVCGMMFQASYGICNDVIGPAL